MPSESVADYTRRPLLSLTVADIGTDETTMENNLHQWFEMAASWDAIIQIDEADVFLEKRTVADLRRNSLVSGECLNKAKHANGSQADRCSLSPLHGVLHRDAISSIHYLLKSHPFMI